MSAVTRSSFLAIAAALSAHVAFAQDIGQPGFVPLYDKKFPYNAIPYQVDPDPSAVRGPQSGYNICNATTQGQDSSCQTMVFNGIGDFCLWSSPKPNQPIADTEAVEVAWCTDKKYGARVIPQGTIKGVQFLNAPDYIEMIAFLDQTLINLPADDFGGELDPHGADLRGNPMGGLVYSTAFSGGTDLTQVADWNEFIGGGQMCIKLCNPNSPNRAALCENRYDRIGLMYNCPNQAQTGVFEVCDSENQDPVGTYTSNGQVMTYTQPPESLGAITTQPYDVRIPKSSNCKTLQSTDIYTSLLAAPTSASGSPSAGTTPTPTPGQKGSPSGNSSGSGSSSRTSSGGPAPTGANQSSGSANRVSAFATVVGVIAAAAFLA